MAAILAALVTLGGIVPMAAPAEARATDPSVHTRSGRVINMLVVGDSYVAGNGATGRTYHASPDDPTPPGGDYKGPGCWRRHNNASHQAYNSLGSTGFFINRACSGKLTGDVPGEIANLVGTPAAEKTDLIIYSAGGNDASFEGIAKHCLVMAIPDDHVTINGKWVSKNCVDLLEWFPSQLDLILERERGNLQELLAKFPNARIVMNGYPMLTSSVQSTGKQDVSRNTANYAFGVLKTTMPSIRDKQKQLVAEVSAASGGRVAFNDVFAKFGGVANNHGLYSANPWLLPLQPPNRLMESVHPNGTGQTKIADGIVATVNAKGWFTDFPVNPASAAATFYFVPTSGGPDNLFRLSNRNGREFTTPYNAVPELKTCAQSTLTFNGWRGGRRNLDLVNPGPDTIKVVCEYPRPGDIVADGSDAYLAVKTTAQSPIPGIKLVSIPTGWMYECLAAGSGVRKYVLTRLEILAAKGAGTVKGRANCVPQEWRGHVVKAPNGASYYVDASGYRHHIRSTQTFYWATQTYGPAIEVSPQVDVDTIPAGTDQPEQLYAPTHYNTIIRRADGVSWVVDGSGVRHHIPFAQDDVCWRLLRGLRVSETGLSAELAGSLPEADKWPCIIGIRIVKSDSGHSYTVGTDNVRHWIPDTDTYAVLAKSYPVSGPWPAADVNQIPEGARETYRLNPDDVRNSIVCRSDGVCWAVDGSAVRHHIPTHADNVCWRWVNGWKVTRSGLNAEKAGSLPEGGAWGCSLNRRVFATNEGAAYWFDGNTRRWIQDTESFYAYAEMSSGPVVRGIGMAEVSPIPEGGWMPKRLSPNRVKNRIVRVTDGTAYFIDGGGRWHWIPNGGVWNCLVARYPVLISNATWEQVNSIRNEGNPVVWATCSM